VLARISALVFFLATPMVGVADAPVSPEQIPGVVKVDAEGLLDLVQRMDRLVIVDARLRSDRRFGYIENSVSLPDVETNCASLAREIPRKNDPVLLYCNGPKCGRSAKAAQKALACGYKRIFWFRGGFEEWQAKGYPSLKD
jgi:rhodanese-related sulfurtransferase